MNINTHHHIDSRLCGTPVELSKGYARVEIDTISAMRADDSGLIHGGFIFGLADYAAMLAVNNRLGFKRDHATVEFLKNL